MLPQSHFRMEPFQFKHFTVHQDRCAMKIGTDGVLLGAWTALKNKPSKILDVGAGTGVISLMLAQRSGAEEIDALEIDENAYEQCVDNFEASPWGDRLFCYHAGFEEFFEEPEDPYDLIVSNPPFFSPSNKTKPIASSDVESPPITKTSRKWARTQETLSFEALICGVSKLLAHNGRFSTIIPVTEEKSFIALAAHYRLYPLRQTRVRGSALTKLKRSLLEFGRFESPVQTDELTIEIGRHHYTPEYIALTKDFYLKM